MKRVLVYSPLQLVCESIVSLLSSSQDVEVVACEMSTDAVLRRVRDNEPDVVVLGSEETAVAPSSLVLRLLQEGYRAKVIELGLRGRVMSVYQVDQVQVTDTADLLEAIGLAPGGGVGGQQVPG